MVGCREVSTYNYYGRCLICQKEEYRGRQEITDEYLEEIIRKSERPADVISHGVCSDIECKRKYLGLAGLEAFLDEE